MNKKKNMSSIFFVQVFISIVCITLTGCELSGGNSLSPGIPNTNSLSSSDFDYYAGWNMDAVSAPEARAISSGSPDVIVALVDDGVDFTHPAISANCIPGYDFVDNDSDPSNDTYTGTYLAGIIAGNGQVPGVAPEVKILPVKINRKGLLERDKVAESIDYALSRNADIILWTGHMYLEPGEDKYNLFKAAIERARAAGVLVITCAGNDGRDLDYLYPAIGRYPAQFTSDNVLTVTATNGNDDLDSLANYGVNSVDIGAPGELIFSSASPNTYEFRRFHATAAAHVAGAAALLKSIEPGISYRAIKNILLQSVDKIDSLPGKILSGGRLNVYNALQLRRTNYGSPIRVYDNACENMGQFFDPLTGGVYTESRKGGYTFVNFTPVVHGTSLLVGTHGKSKGDFCQALVLPFNNTYKPDLSRGSCSFYARATGQWRGKGDDTYVSSNVYFYLTDSIYVRVYGPAKSDYCYIYFYSNGTLAASKTVSKHAVSHIFMQWDFTGGLGDGNHVRFYFNGSLAASSASASPGTDWARVKQFSQYFRLISRCDNGGDYRTNGVSAVIDSIRFWSGIAGLSDVNAP
ncbi:MAG: S8 family serine peptidase [bacterium]|nr:S8 family serine peptidase [bacterium]